MTTWRLSVRVGDLVKVTRAHLGVPLNSVGLIVSSVTSDSSLVYYSIRFVSWPELSYHRRYMGCDLEIVNAAR
jgi:hypothetical protein